MALPHSESMEDTTDTARQPSGHWRHSLPCSEVSSPSLIPCPSSHSAKCLEIAEGAPFILQEPSLPSLAACCYRMAYILLGPIIVILLTAVGLFMSLGVSATVWYAVGYACVSLALVAITLLHGARATQRLIDQIAAQVLQLTRPGTGESPVHSDPRLSYIQAVLWCDAKAERVEITDPLAFVQRDLQEVGASAAGHVVINTTGIMLWANDAFCTYFGYKPEEIVGDNIRILMPSPYNVQHDHFVRKHIRTGQRNILGRSREVPVVDKAGNQSIVMLRVEDRIDRSDEENRLFLGRMDFRLDDAALVAVKKHLKAGEATLRTAFVPFEAARESIVAIDPKGTICYVNRATSLLFGWDRKEMVGQNVRMLMGEPFRSAHDGFLKRYEERALECQRQGGLWPASTIIGGGRDVMALTKVGRPVRVFIMVHRLDRPSGTVEDCVFVAKMVHIAQRESAPGGGPADRSVALSETESNHGPPSTHPTAASGTARWVPLGALKRRRCTIAIVEGRMLNMEAACIEDVHREYEQFLSIVHNASSRHKGVVHAVVGGRLILVFNAPSLANSSHRTSAASCLLDVARLFANCSLVQTMGLRLGAASGDVHSGMWGPRPVLTGELLDRTAALLALQHEAAVANPVVDGPLYEELQYAFHCRLVNRATVWPGTRRQDLLEAYELCGLKQSGEDEWMYQLQSGDGGALQHWRRAWDHLPPPVQPHASADRGPYHAHHSLRPALYSPGEAIIAIREHLRGHPGDATALWLMEALGAPAPEAEDHVQHAGTVPFTMQFRAALSAKGLATGTPTTLSPTMSATSPSLIPVVRMQDAVEQY